MRQLSPIEIADPEKLQLALQLVTIDDRTPVLGALFCDARHVYGHLNVGELLLWRLTPIADGYEDLRFVLLPLGELGEKTVLEMLEEVCRDGGWE